MSKSFLPARDFSRNAAFVQATLPEKSWKSATGMNIVYAWRWHLISVGQNLVNGKHHGKSHCRAWACTRSWVPTAERLDLDLCCHG